MRNSSTRLRNSFFMVVIVSKVFLQSLSSYLVIFPALVVLVSPVPAEILRVSKTGDGTDGLTWETSYTTIGKALAASASQDEIWVAAGRYNGYLNLWERANISLYGGFAGTETSREQRDWTAHPYVIDASGKNQSALYVYRSNRLVIDGFTITHGTLPFETGGDGSGVHLYKSDFISMRNCTIAGNSSKGHGGGVYCQEATADFTNCTIAGNRASLSGGGVYCDTSSATFTNCILWNPGAEILIDSGSAIVSYSCIQGGYEGIGNIAAYPMFVAPDLQDWRLADLSPCVDGGVDVGHSFLGNAPDMGAWESPAGYVRGATEYVPSLFHVVADASPSGDGSSWETAISSMRSALWISSVSDEIWLAQGLYRESIYLEPGVSVLGGFTGSEKVQTQRDSVAYPTTIRGDPEEGRVIAADGADGVTIDGLTVTGGMGGIRFENVDSATLTNCAILGNGGEVDGGGVACHRASLLIYNCLIAENTGFRSGGGLYAEYSSPKILNCTFTENWGRDGGGARFFVSTPLVVDCTMDHNAAGDGGGATLASGRATLINCSISDNKAGFGAGLQITDPTSRIENCRIAGNEAFYGAGVFCKDANPVIENCLITENTAPGFGAAAHLVNSSPEFVNCTIAGNTKDSRVAGVYGSSSFPVLVNCIIWNSATHEVSIESGTPIVTYGCVHGGFPGSGNISDYPSFEAPEAGDWRLGALSPCIDGGNPGTEFFDGCLPPGLGDLRNDMGAFGGPLNCGWPGSLPAPTQTPTPTPTQSPFVPSDLTLDDKVDARDLLCLLKAWCSGVVEASPEDLYDDEAMDMLDLALFQESWHQFAGGR